ncbi:hypothetical protein [Hydrogenophaga sp.]|uniref:hypothetical protein n=1 Tax=Hydrogenophaga sp. TaxID=1904254 RepID=UPI00286E098A|nr:hypothetical protein [Hydrogenophaga sp.]
MRLRPKPASSKRRSAGTILAKHATSIHPMNPSDEEPRVISADGPINRRTALIEQRRREAADLPAHPEVRERVLRIHLRNAMGAPLAEQLAPERTGTQQAPSGLLIGAGVLVACGTVLGLLGVIQSSGLTILGGAAIAVLGLAGMVWARRQAGQATQAAPAQPLFDPATLDAFDRVLEDASNDLGEVALQRLTAIKESVVRIAIHAKGVDEHFTNEDRMYLRECLRRYVPDTLEAFLRVPAAQRQSPLLDGQASAETTMLRQLSSLHEEVTQREKKIGRSAAEGLMKQDRFLASKRSR